VKLAQLSKILVFTICSSFATFCFGSSSFNDLTLEAVDNPTAVGVFNRHFSHLYKNKLDTRPRDLIPKEDKRYNLGFSTMQWLSVNAEEITISTITATSATITNLTVTNLTQGAITKIHVFSDAGNQAIPSGGQHKINFNTANFDTLGEFNLTADTFTVTEAGFYWIHGVTHFPSNTATVNTIGLSINGSLKRILSTAGLASGNDSGIQFTVFEELAANDSIHMSVSQNSGGSLNLILSNQKTYFIIMRIL